MPANDPNDPEIAVLKDYLEQYRKIYDVGSAGDPDRAAVERLYKMDDDFVAFDIAPPLAGYQGWDAYSTAWYKVLGKYSEIQFKIRDDARIHRKGDVAWMSFSADWFGTSRDGAKFAKAFRQTMVWVRENGRWLIVQEHGSSPLTTTLSSGEVV